MKTDDIFGVFAAVQKLTIRLKELEQENDRLRKRIIEEQVKWLIPTNK